MVLSVMVVGLYLIGAEIYKNTNLPFGLIVQIQYPQLPPCFLKSRVSIHEGRNRIARPRATTAIL